MLNKFYSGKEEYKICKSETGYVNLGNIENYNKHKTELPRYVSLYPFVDETYNSLISKIAKYCECKEEQILITNGSGAGLDAILHTFTNYDTTIAIPVPNYPGFIHSASLHGKIKKYIYDEDTVEQNIIGCGIAYFSNPNLPLGYCLNLSKIISIISRNPNTLFIIDEAYFEYGKKKSFASLNLNNLIVTRTFSKAFILAGARIGYVISSSDIISKLRIGFCSKNVTNESIKYANEVLTNKQHYIDNVDNDIKLLREIELELKNIMGSNIYDYVINNVPWILLKCKDVPSVCKMFKLNKILVRDKCSDINNCVRVTLGTRDHMNDVINIIRLINYGCENLYIDLDITLRTDYKSNISPDLIELIQKATIVTDNYKNTEDLQHLFKKIISPISEKMNPNREDWFVYDNSVYILKFVVPDHKLLESLQKYGEIRIIEDDFFINSSELGLLPNIKIPHIGTLLNLLPNYKIKKIGKSNLAVKGPGLMIGDSENDRLFAKKNKLCFIKVNNSQETKDVLLFIRQIFNP